MSSSDLLNSIYGNSVYPNSLYNAAASTSTYPTLTPQQTLQALELMREYGKGRSDNTVSNENFRMRALGMRLRLKEGEMFPFEHLNTAHSGEKVFCFLVVKNSPVVLEDEAVLFPSDTLVSQLLMLKD